MILVKQEINCESTEKDFLANIALFLDAVAFEKYNVQVCRFNFDWRKGWCTRVDTGMKRFERADHNTECSFYFDVYEFDDP